MINLPSDRHMLAIGRMVVVWSALEAVMEIAIAHFYEVDPRVSLVFTANIPFVSRLAMLRNVANGGGVGDRTRTKAFLEFLAQLEVLSGIRNPEDANVASQMKISVKGQRVTTASERRSFESIDADCARMEGLYDSLNVFLDELGCFNDVPTESSYSSMTRKEFLV